MKLSEAILLGDTLKTCDPRQFISPDGSCGCALGGALLAAGANPADVSEGLNADIWDDIPQAFNRWPWLKIEHICHISNMYFDVARGKATLEQIAEYVRSIEPADPKPEPFPVDDEQPETQEVRR